MKPNTKKAFAAWCAKKPADESYDWSDDTNCALAQYARHIKVSPEDLPIAWESIAMNGHEDWTFGKLAQRLRA